eukprot:1149198-Pelagomonas_calceolata.AAC.1
MKKSSPLHTPGNLECTQPTAPPVTSRTLSAGGGLPQQDKGSAKYVTLINASFCSDCTLRKCCSPDPAPDPAVDPACCQQHHPVHTRIGASILKDPQLLQGISYYKASAAFRHGTAQALAEPVCRPNTHF